MTFELLNQVADTNHHRVMFRYRPADNAVAGDAWGYEQFTLIQN